MCHFCPVEIKSLGLGVRRIFLVLMFLFFLLFALHIGSSTLGKKKKKTTNMAFAKQCIMKTWTSSIAFGVQHPAIFQSRTKQTNKNQCDLRFELGKLCIPKDLSKDILTLQKTDTLSSVNSLKLKTKESEWLKLHFPLQMLLNRFLPWLW